MKVQVEVTRLANDRAGWLSLELRMTPKPSLSTALQHGSHQPHMGVKRGWSEVSCAQIVKCTADSEDLG